MRPDACLGGPPRAPRAGRRSRRADKSPARNSPAAARPARRTSRSSGKRRCPGRPRPASHAQALHQVVDLGGVAARLDVVGGMADDALLVDDEGGADQAFAPRPVLALLFLQYAVHPAHLALGIGEQRDGDAVLVAEIGVREAVIARHAKAHAVELAELVLVS